MERLDKFLSLALKISRSEAKAIVRKQKLTVNSERITDSDFRIDPQKDTVSLNGKCLIYKKHIYIMLNKPRGVISASDDKSAKTVIDLVPPELKRKGLFPAGRLDADTVGFVLITDDGDFAHRILSPKKHVEKTYEAKLAHTLSDGDIENFRSGLTLSDGTRCLEAKVRMLSQSPPLAEVIIHEGKYHQVKRMFAAIGNRVLELKRIKIGGLSLDPKLKDGQCREITADELKLIENMRPANENA